MKYRNYHTFLIMNFNNIQFSFCFWTKRGLFTDSVRFNKHKSWTIFAAVCSVIDILYEEMILKYKGINLSWINCKYFFQNCYIVNMLLWCHIFCAVHLST